MAITRRDFLGISAMAPFLLSNFLDADCAAETLATPTAERKGPEAVSGEAIPHSANKALDVYKAIRDTTDLKNDLVTPQQTRTTEGEYIVLLLQRVLNNEKFRYTIVAKTYLLREAAGYRALPKGGLEINRRTKGNSYHTSLITVTDRNLDGLVDRGMTRGTGHVITLRDKEWNKVCQEYAFRSEGNVSYKDLFQRMYVQSLDDIARQLRL